MELAASFDAQLSTLAPFIFYVVIGAIVFVETGLLFGFFCRVTQFSSAQA